LKGRILNIYVASSWRSERQPELIQLLRRMGHDVYDFRNPSDGDNGFHWSEIDPEWQSWSPLQFRAALRHPIARDGYRKDMQALIDCDMCILVMPCGRSAHLEIGFASGAGKLTAILVEQEAEPELTYGMVGHVCVSLDELLELVRECSAI